MALQHEEEASRAFMQVLLEKLQSCGVSSKELELVLEQILPVLVPATVHLLKAVVASEERRDDGDSDEPPIQPLNHIARYMFRRNPRHVEPSAETAEMQVLARRLLRK